MKKIHYLSHAAIFLAVIYLFTPAHCFGQCGNASYIQVDGNLVLADNSTNGQQFPFWLTAGETLAVNQGVYSISVIEFDSVGTSLAFSKVVKVTTQQTVPTGKVWKVEAVINQPNTSAAVAVNNTTITLTTPGTATWTVPACVSYICVQAWGAGGGGGSGASPTNSGAGGGGGGYGSGCFTVTPGSSLSVTVGLGGAAGTSNSSNGTINGADGGPSSVGALISAAGGGGGPSSGTGGAGGTSTAPVNFPGQSGNNSGGNGNVNNAALGGSSGNGGAGGGFTGSGTAPGGGGGGGYNQYGGTGANGEVIISW